MSFDFHSYTLNFIAGNEQDDLPGSLAAAAPRMANRLRKDDLIAMLLTLRGKGVEKDEVNKFTRQLAEVFFRTMGSVTRAMNAVGMESNRILMDYNLDRAHEGAPLEGILNLAVLHKGTMFLCHAGPATSFVLTPDTLKAFREEDDVKPMGANRNIGVTYYQADVKPGMLLLFSPNPPHTWTSSHLSNSSFLNMEEVRRRLLNQAGEDLQALVIKVQPGDGYVKPGAWGAQPAIKEPERIEEATLETISSRPIFQSEEIPTSARATESLPETKPVQQEESIPAPQKTSPGQPSLEVSMVSQKVDTPLGDAVEVKPGVTESAQPIGKRFYTRQQSQKKKSSQLSIFIIDGIRKVQVINAKIKTFFANLVKRIFPKVTNWQAFSPAVMTFLLVLIPLALITVALTVYSHSGKREQFQIYLQQAQQYQALAASQTDPLQKHDLWNKTLEMVTLAEQYGSNSQSTNLRTQAQSTLDGMDLTKRLEFRLALTTRLPDTVQITKILPVGTDIYLLDATSGAILRVAFNPKGYYEADASFKCTPGPSGLNTIGPLIDVISLPPNQPFGYKLMAIDTEGNLLYCLAGSTPSSQRLPAPSGGWKKLVGIALDQNLLYALDAENDSVWFYEGEGINFASAPKSFFDERIPDLGGAINLTVNQDDLFVLHADGHMTTCQYSAYKQAKKTECSDPAPYSDDRLGREKHPWIFMDAHFISLQATFVPNASIYLLDDSKNMIYQLSYQLNLESTLSMQPSQTYPIPATKSTAFAVSPAQTIFMAFGNQLFLATMP